MTTLDTPSARAGRRRRPTPPGYEESVQQAVPEPGGQHGRPRHPDPPIYGDLLARWAAAGRTLPGRRDPEWSRITSSPIWPSGPLYNSP
ncbi:hypothetical protein [Streptomyces sp. NBC_00158]|uniref:hypothetical protein n=1 Tax=Streptomyces sp. NBC_00158 TaxID=2903627 RepID=UPI0032540229